MTPASPHVHQWLDAIQRGRITATAEPQLWPEVPTPSAEEQVALQALHHDLTGELLSTQWLAEVLQPMPASTIALVPPPAPETLLPERGWKHWWGLVQRQRERPVHQFRSDREAKQSFLRWRRVARLTWWPGFALLMGNGWWAMERLLPQAMQLDHQWREGVKAAGSEAAFQAQPLAHQLSEALTHIEHQFGTCSTLVLAGAALMVVGNVLGAVQKNRKAVAPSVAERLTWLQSPRAQRYLQQRWVGQPFLLGDRARLNALARSDRVHLQSVEAPLFDREPTP